MQAVRIILLCIAATTGYGIIHDQITVRISLEYFTIAHPPVFPTSDPTLLGLGWGVLATWWVGASLGVLLAIAARAGSWPKLAVRQVLPHILFLLTLCAVSAIIAGVIGYNLASEGSIQLSGRLAEEISPARHARFFADAFAIRRAMQ